MSSQPVEWSKATGVNWSLGQILNFLNLTEHFFSSSSATNQLRSKRAHEMIEKILGQNFSVRDVNCEWTRISTVTIKVSVLFLFRMLKLANERETALSPFSISLLITGTCPGCKQFWLVCFYRSSLSVFGGHCRRRLLDTALPRKQQTNRTSTALGKKLEWKKSLICELIDKLCVSLSVSILEESRRKLAGWVSLNYDAFQSNIIFYTFYGICCARATDWKTIEQNILKIN